MERKVIISDLNQYVFKPKGIENNYHYTNPDLTTNPYLTSTGYPSVIYVQPVEQQDPCFIQIWVSQEGLTPVLRVLDEAGNQIGAPTNFTLVPLSYQLIRNNITYNAWYIRDVSFFEELNGRYFLEITCDFDIDGNGSVDFSDKFLSSPIWVRPEHKSTSVINYSNSENRDGMIFSVPGYKQRFVYRLNGIITSMQPKVSRTVFTDQNETPVQLSAYTSKTWKFIAGYHAGIADEVLVKLNDISSLDGMYINGKGYVPVDGSSFAKEQANENLLCSASIELGEKDQNLSSIFTNGDILVIPNALAFPYVVGNVLVGYENNVAYSYNTFLRIDSEATLDAYVLSLNAAKVDNGVVGVFSKSNGEVVYTNGLAENYNFATCISLRNRLGVKNVTTGVASIFQTYTMASLIGGGSQIVVCHPGGAVAIKPIVSQSTVDYIIPPYTAPGAGTYTTEIWDNGTLATLYLKGALISGISRFTSLSLPEGLMAFGIENSTKLTTFNFYTEMFDVRKTLFAFRLYNNSVLTDCGTMFTPFAGATSYGFYQLAVVFLQNNKLSQAIVDTWFHGMKLAATQVAPAGEPNGINGSTFYTPLIVVINGQTPPAPPTISSAADRSYMAAAPFNCTYATD